MVHLDNLKAPPLPETKKESIPEIKVEPLERPHVEASTHEAVPEPIEKPEYSSIGSRKADVIPENPEEVKPDEKGIQEAPKQEVPKQDDVDMKEVKVEAPPPVVSKSEISTEVLKEDGKTVTPAISSVAQWQSYAGEPKGFQVVVFSYPDY